MKWQKIYAFRFADSEYNSAQKPHISSRKTERQLYWKLDVGFCRLVYDPMFLFDTKEN